MQRKELQSRIALLDKKVAKIEIEKSSNKEERSDVSLSRDRSR